MYFDIFVKVLGYLLIVFIHGLVVVHHYLVVGFITLVDRNSGILCSNLLLLVFNVFGYMLAVVAVGGRLADVVSIALGKERVSNAAGGRRASASKL